MGFSLHDELQLMASADLTPLQALQTAAVSPARFLGRLDELGTIGPGKLADIVVPDANPLNDIGNVVKIRNSISLSNCPRPQDHFVNRANPNSVSPAPTTRYCVPSSS